MDRGAAAFLRNVAHDFFDWLSVGAVLRDGVIEVEEAIKQRVDRSGSLGVGLECGQSGDGEIAWRAVAPARLAKEDPVADGFLRDLQVIVSISVEKFPGNSVQKFPLAQPAFGCF